MKQWNTEEEELPCSSPCLSPALSARSPECDPAPPWSHSLLPHAPTDTAEEWIKGSASQLPQHSESPCGTEATNLMLKMPEMSIWMRQQEGKPHGPHQGVLPVWLPYGKPCQDCSRIQRQQTKTKKCKNALEQERSGFPVLLHTPKQQKLAENEKKAKARTAAAAKDNYYFLKKPNSLSKPVL